MLAERSIDREWVERTIAEPTAIEFDASRPGTIRAFRPIPERGGRMLRVVYISTGETARVLTVFFDRARRR